MKKILYFILLAAELFIGTLLMISLWSSNLPIVCGAVVVVMAALLLWQIIRLRKLSDPAAKQKILRNIALIMLLPMAAFAVVFVCVAVALIIAFI